MPIMHLKLFNKASDSSALLFSENTFYDCFQSSQFISEKYLNIFQLIALMIILFQIFL